MPHLEQRRTLPPVACAHAQHVGCPHAPRARTGSAYPRSQWLRGTRAFACRCNERLGALLVLTGWAGIAGFCAASLGFFAGILNEPQYLIGVAASLAMFAASVLIARLGDPYELKRMESQRGHALQPVPVLLSRAGSGSVTRPPRAAMN